MKLHHFHSSSTSFRVRIALNLKGIAFESVPVILRWKDGDHDDPAYAELNPQRNVPVLVDGDVKVVQSSAILEYLEEIRPEPPLLPGDPAGRARVRSIAQHVACEVQPLNNLRVERYLAERLLLEPNAMREWRRHWITVGFDAVEAQLGDGGMGRFCHGDAPTMADAFLVPQVFNALRPTVGLELDPWPRIARVYRACLELEAFERALPKHQVGYVEPTGH
jgi:maleylacetoacetate isomerase